MLVWMNLSDEKLFSEKLSPFSFPQEPAYNPQVEAISPTLPPEETSSSRENILQSISKVDREIAKVDDKIRKLRTKQVCSWKLEGTRKVNIRFCFSQFLLRLDCNLLCDDWEDSAFFFHV